MNSELLDFTLKLADLGRDYISKNLLGDLEISAKPDKSLVTQADIEIENIWRKEISSKYPEHGILGEEHGLHNESASIRWVLDPIDGTLSFTRGIPLFGSIIAVLKDGKPIIGLIDHPGINLRTWAEQGKGAFQNNQQIKITDKDEFDQEVIARSDRANFIRSGLEDWQTELDKLHPRVRAYADCFGHTLACSGSVGAMIDMNVCIWDISATELIVSEAGGVCERIEEKSDGRYSIIAGKSSVVKTLTKHFRQCSK